MSEPSLLKGLATSGAMSSQGFQRPEGSTSIQIRSEVLGRPSDAAPSMEKLFLQFGVERRAISA